MRNVTLAATQMAWNWDIENNLRPAEALIREAAERGADVIPIQELFATSFYGSSFIADSTGAKVAEANRADETILIAAFDLDAIEVRRRAWALFRDRRP